ncbi:hypothetical protein X566_13935 [Afipia sp. P52-10]|uniref:DUF3551 domain-containing protein n=1 Tax=Afipia sp. P52-10 TaxID=1429916 RepID=UPI0003DF1136|nr:DUF3551 domain-containing protein [Afipia sp. P52-10]ETR78637.1 hypothetical protein X566_13935 [Afipia sp. P52-10]
MTMRKLMIVLCTLAASVVVSSTADAQQGLRFRDDRGFDRGTAWCLRPYYARGDYDCRYYTYEQCQATAAGNIGFCEPSPWAVEQAQRAQAASPRPYKRYKKPRRQQYQPY